MRRHLALTVVPALVAAAVTIVSAPAAQATDTSGFAVQLIQHSFTVPSAGRDSGTRLTMTVACPAGTTPIAGGVATPAGSPYGVIRYQDYVNFGDGATVVESVENYTYIAQPVTIYARCALTRWFHSTGRVVTTPGEDNQTGQAGGYAVCPSGSIALSARVDWNDNTTHNQWITNSGPTTDLKGWFATGSTWSTNRYMFIDVQCIAASDFPGAYLIQSTWKNPGNSRADEILDTVCYPGMTPLNGGTYILDADGSVDVDSSLGYAYRSEPGVSGWNSSAAVNPQDTLYVSTWCVPSGRPTVTIGGPPSYTTNAAAQFSFAATDPSGEGRYTLSYMCGLDEFPSTPCASPLSTTVSQEGYHYEEVTVTTSDGRTATGVYGWVYDDTAPTATMTAPTKPFSLSSQVAVGWSGTDGTGSGVSAFNVRYKDVDHTGALGPWQYPASWQHTTAASGTSTIAAGATQCFSAQALDRAGNASGYSAANCTARPVDDAALNASSGWTHVSDPAYWNGTYSATTTQNATLTLPGVHLDRAGIVALTCPTCGKVALLVGTTQVGTINLHSTSTQHQVVHAVPKFTAVTGTVTVKVISSGKTVNIDGLAVSQR